jgi:hypothetical protein
LSLCYMYDRDILGNLIACPNKITINPTPIAARPVNFTERPELFFEKIVIGTLVPGKPEVVKMLLRNRGKVAARNISLWGTEALTTNPFNETLKLETIEPETCPDLGADAEMTVIPHIRRPLTAEWITGIQSGRILLFHYGKIEYEDDFGNKYPLKFCYLYQPSLKLMSLCPDRYWPKGRNTPETA